MRRKARSIRKLYIAAIAGFGLSSLALAGMSLPGLLNEDAGKTAGYIIAALFWAGLIVGAVFSVLACCKMRPMRKSLCEKGKIDPDPLPGAVRFVNRPFSIALYIIIAICLVMAITDIILHWLPAPVLYIILGTVLMATAVHCLIDGKNFKAYKYIKEGNRK